MRRLRLAEARPLLAMLALVLACAGPADGDGLPDTTEPPPPDVRSEYLDVHLSEGSRLCPPMLERLDAEVERISEALGLGPPDPEERIVMHYGYAAVDERCNAHRPPGVYAAAGCADPDELWIAAQPGTESHELVHHLRQREELEAPRYWEEGLATYIGAERPHRTQDVEAERDGDLAQSLGDAPSLDAQAYAESAHLIAYIDRTRGSDVLGTLSTTLAFVEPDAAFEQVLGVSVSDMEAEWKAESETTHSLELPCESTLAVGEEPVIVRGEIGCEVPGVIGPGPGASKTEEVFRGPLHCFRTPPGSTLTVSMRGSDHAAVTVRARVSDACPSHDPTRAAYVHAGETRELETEGCEWSVTYVAYREDDVEYEIEVALH